MLGNIGNKGFSLIEVLVAMVVLSVGLLELGRMQIVAIKVNSASQHLTQASNMAQERIERLMALPFTHESLVDNTPTNQDAWTTYTEPQPPEGYTISWQVNDYPADPATKAINMYVSWKNFGQEKNVALAFLKSDIR